LCTGLRPGEKLYEELLIDAESEATAHPLIYRARERAVPPDELWPQIDAMEEAIARQDVEAALGVLEWRPWCPSGSALKEDQPIPKHLKDGLVF